MATKTERLFLIVCGTVLHVIWLLAGWWSWLMIAGHTSKLMKDRKSRRKHSRHFFGANRNNSRDHMTSLM